ncbi:sugar nucleotide-binding protein [Microlunatus elymi]|uniref:dTDP-4-dehydrorhamnose reductase n=1 Tax=Microlunatus elymi TaxID=2596828 RepID=A0A516Q4E4_9ACTN|nr:bifunctional dTDP-4-dehydrorhamnose 3,5-epimerase family protein/NAD(P)-dependent oxidoreductase [Microlunatus elymi]QDP98316.1 sugar nucleotide-binding protein [Microlunatus elymi]
MADLTVTESPIPGLSIIELPLQGDNRGWFKENWQREKMIKLGLPDFGPVQNNISFNEAAGVTRGLHAEPWDKYVALATGRIFGAWVDLREGDSFGTVYTHELGPDTAIFVPRGVANGYQTLEPNTAYSYLVNEHWSEGARSDYTFLNLADETAAIDWPIPLEQCELSEADKGHPRLAEVRPMRPKRTVIIGGNGQLGRALAAALPDAVATDRSVLDLASPSSLAAFDWRDYDVVINAAAHTAVDAAETPQGRRDAWVTNVTGPAALAEIARRHRLTVVHISSDYVFDGSEELHAEEEPLSPLGVYGQTKAAGDLIIAGVPKHYIVRTSWVIGDGNNFVRTMIKLADQGIEPTVVDDQLGRLTFTDDLARGITHLLRVRPAYGVYNLTSDGEPKSWASLAKIIFAARGKSADAVTPVSTETYGKGKDLAPRPANSVLDLTKIKSTGFVPSDQNTALGRYLDDPQ